MTAKIYPFPDKEDCLKRQDCAFINQVAPEFEVALARITELRSSRMKESLPVAQRAVSKYLWFMLGVTGDSGVVEPIFDDANYTKRDSQ